MTQTTADPRLAGMFDQGLQAFGDALKAGVKAQEEVARWWSDALHQNGPVQEWQKKSQSLVSDAFPAYQKNAQEWLKIVEQNYKRSLDLLRTALANEEGAEPADLQARTQKLWEASLGIVRENTQAMTQANLKLMETWSDLLRKASNGHVEPK